MGVGGQEWVLGWTGIREHDEEKEKTEGLQSMYCAENNGTQGPSWGEMLVIRGQRVDDVITIAPTNFVLYIIMPTALPPLSHVDPSLATTSPLSPWNFVL